MDRKKMTVVFEVKDREAVKQLYDAHKSGTLVCGMIPTIISWGDQVSVPEEIINGLVELDPDFVDEKELSELCELAINHRKFGGE